MECHASIAQKTGVLEPLVIGAVRGFGNLVNGPDPQAGLAGDSIKGEAFREGLDGVLHAKVRRFGIEMGAMSRKCPADRSLHLCVYLVSDCKGEAFRGARRGNKKCCGAKSRLEVRFYGDTRRLRISRKVSQVVEIMDVFHFRPQR